jgi:hypothetical protein
MHAGIVRGRGGALNRIADPRVAGSGGVTVTVDEQAIAEPRPCVRCSRLSLLSVVGRCADCISELGLGDDPAEFQAWKADVQAEYGRK